MCIGIALHTPALHSCGELFLLYISTAAFSFASKGAHRSAARTAVCTAGLRG